MTLVPLPTLDDLARDPARAMDLHPEAAWDLLLQIAPLVEAIRLRALAPLPTGQNGQPEAPGEDRLLDVKAVAARLGRSYDFVYRRRWPFEVQGDGRGRRFSALGLARYLRQRTGR